MTRLAQFMKQEDGATTVDWIVLIAAVVGLAITAVEAAERGNTQVAGEMLVDVRVNNGD
ncbi:MAG: hypothetical protein RIG84_11690 [Roseovarius sp.]